MARTSLMARIVSIALTVMVLTLNIGLDARSALADVPIAQDASQPSVNGPVFQPGESVSWLGLGSSSLRPLTRLAQECVPAGSEESALPDIPVCEETVQEPVVEEPVYQEPVVEEPVYQEPVVEEPVVEEPTTEPVIEPTTEPVIEPTTEPEPTVEATDEPSAPPAETTPDATVEATEEATTPEAEATATDEGVSAQSSDSDPDDGTTLSNDPSTEVAVPGDTVSFTVRLERDEGFLPNRVIVGSLTGTGWTITLVEGSVCSNDDSFSTTPDPTIECDTPISDVTSIGYTATKLVTPADCASGELESSVSAYRFDDSSGDVGVAAVPGNYEEYLSADDFIDVDCPDLAVDKAAGASPINAGDPASFTVDVTNDGDGTAYDVTLTDTLPAGVDWAETADSDGVCAVAGGALSCGPVDLATGEGFSVTVAGTTDAADCAAGLTNTATAAATNEPADVLADNSATATIDVDCPDLAVEKTGNGPVSAGDPASFAITVTNGGEGIARNVTLTDDLPDGVDWADDNEDCAIDPDVGETGQVLDCAFGDLDPDGSVSVTLTGTTDATDCGTLTNTATAAADNEAAADTGNNSATATIDVVCPAELAVSKTASVTTAAPGDTITYLYLITNTGGDTAIDVTAVDDLGTSGFVDDDEVVCGGLTILPGTTVQCTFDVVVSDLFAGSDLTNVVTVTGTSALGEIVVAAATAVATVTIVEVEELEPCSFPVVFIFVSDIEFASADGTPLFTINQGSQLTFPSGSQSGGGCESDDWTFTGSINGQPASFSFKGTLRPNGTTASAGVRALPMLATSDLVLEITEINTVNWDVSGLPEPQAPVAVQFSTAPTGTRLEVAGVNAEVSISPDLEVPFQSINEYHISKASLPDVGSGQWSIGGGASGLPLGLITILPVLLLLLATRLRGGNALRTARVPVRASRAR